MIGSAAPSTWLSAALTVAVVFCSLFASIVAKSAVNGDQRRTLLARLQTNSAMFVQELVASASDAGHSDIKGPSAAIGPPITLDQLAVMSDPQFASYLSAKPRDPSGLYLIHREIDLVISRLATAKAGSIAVNKIGELISRQEAALRRQERANFQQDVFEIIFGTFLTVLGVFLGWILRA